MTGIKIKLATVFMSVVAMLFVSMGTASAHHCCGEYLYVSPYSVSHMTFYDDRGYSFNVGVGAGSCCYQNAYFRVGSSHDVTVVDNTYGFYRRYNAAGTYPVPKLGSPEHMTFRAFYNGVPG